MDSTRELRKRLDELLDGGEAHVSFERATASFPEDMRGKRPAAGLHSGWELLEHLRIAQ